ncbi:unnamed protein product [marine sediment metagenome]|uniref:Uncharacterized protein n=1 Tax=marine sediment metagenome TaxID=412755 RepID=X1HBB3_9ZZZZ
MVKCERCGRELTSEASIKRRKGLWCSKLDEREKKESPLEGVVIADLLERMRKVELDNNFMKYQLKHKQISVGSARHPDANLDWKKNLKPEIQQVISVFEGKFSNVIKDLKALIIENKPLLKKGLRYSNEEIGLQPIEITEVK